jgi:ubiquinone biosynthesis protein
VSGIAFAAVVLVTSVALVAGLAWASRRLLGLPVSAPRALIAGLFGFGAALLVGRWLRAAQPGHVAAFITVALGVPLVVAMVFTVVAEALVPSGGLPGPVEVIRETPRAFARWRRYAQISRIAVRHGLGPYLRGRRPPNGEARGGRAALAVSLRRALEEGGVTFTKLGQLLSTRSDLLPEEFTAELAQLQDRAGPAPWDQVEEVITQSLGAPAEEVFAELQPEPAAFLGAASGIVGALLLGTSSGPKVTPGVSLDEVIGYNLLIVAGILVLRVLFTIFRASKG